MPSPNNNCEGGIDSVIEGDVCWFTPDCLQMLSMIMATTTAHLASTDSTTTKNIDWWGGWGWVHRVSQRK
jgi:hypothetical protein